MYKKYETAYNHEAHCASNLSKLGELKKPKAQKQPNQSALPSSLSTKADLACVVIHWPALPSSLLTKADLAFTESALHFQF